MPEWDSNLGSKLTFYITLTQMFLNDSNKKLLLLINTVFKTKLTEQEEIIKC